MEKKTNKAKLEIFKFLRKSAKSQIVPSKILFLDGIHRRQIKQN